MGAPRFPQITSLRGGRQAEIARVTVADAAIVHAHSELVASETDFLQFGPGQVDRSVELQAAELGALEDPNVGLALKGIVDGELAGLVLIQRQPRPRKHHVGELSLSLAKKFWHIGLGRALCEAAIMHAGEHGITRIELRCRQDNTLAIALYEDVGLRVEGRLRGSFKLADVEYDEVLMAVRLHSGSVPPPRTASTASSM